VVIGRDHLDSGSVASPYRETEAMRDGSDAIADWPILNALLNVAAGATWVSVHHGGGVGIGNSIHAAWSRRDGTTRWTSGSSGCDDGSGHGVMGTSDARLPEARGRERARLEAPMLPSRMSSRAATPLLVRDLATRDAARRAGALRGPALGDVEVLEDAYVLCRGGNDRSGRGGMRDHQAARRRRRGASTRAASAPSRGWVDCHTHACSRATASRSSRCALAGATV
jgi:hypothetical protein